MGGSPWTGFLRNVAPHYSAALAQGKEELSGLLPIKNGTARERAAPHWLDRHREAANSGRGDPAILQELDCVASLAMTV
jgi:hypothetical protein